MHHKIIDKDLSILEELAILAKDSTYAVLDTETTGLKPYAGDKPFLLQILFSKSPDICYLIPFSDFGTENDSFKENEEFYLKTKNFTRELMCSLLKKQDFDLVGHNIKFDLHMLFEFLGLKEFKRTCDVKCNFCDTMTLSRVVKNTEFSYTLEKCCDLFNVKIKKASDTINSWTSINKKVWNKQYDSIPASIMIEYSYFDIFATKELFYSLYDTCLDKFKIAADLQDVTDWVKLVTDMVKITFFMERRGFNINKTLLKEIGTAVRDKVEPLKLQFELESGFEFVSSPESLVTPIKLVTGKGLYKNPKSGRYSASETVLKRMNHPFCNLILEIREYDKLISSFIKPTENLENHDGKVHCNIFTLGAVTFRQSCSEPNLQQQPASKILDKYDFRNVFYSEGYKIVTCDLSASQVRLAASLCNEKELVNAIINKEDPHAINAKKMNTDRKTAKGAFFAMLFGGGAGAIGSSLGISYEDASEILTDLRKAVPAINNKSWDLSKYASSKGYILNHFGIPVGVRNAKDAFNVLIQSTEAMLFYRIVREVDEYCNKCGFLDILLTVHDEIIMRYKEGFEDKYNEVKRDIEHIFTKHYECNGVIMEGEMSELLDFWSK